MPIGIIVICYMQNDYNMLYTLSRYQSLQYKRDRNWPVRELFQVKRVSFGEEIVFEVEFSDFGPFELTIPSTSEYSQRE